MHKETAIAAILAMAGAAWAHSGATGVVKDRMDAMSAMSDAMKVIVPMTRGEVTYDQSAYAEAARSIATHAGQSLVEMFPAGSLMPPSEASPAIWEEFERFSEMALTLEARAEALARAAEATDAPPGAEFGALARSCGSCHEDFRIETD